MEYCFPDALVNYNLLVTIAVKTVFQKKTTCISKCNSAFYRGSFRTLNSMLGMKVTFLSI